MPRSVIYNANLTASTKTANILSGDINEFVPYRARVTIFQVSSATGVRANILADTDIVCEDKEIPYIGTSLDTSAHFMDQFVVAPGTRLSITLRETAAAGTTDVYTAVDIQPV